MKYVAPKFRLEQIAPNTAIASANCICYNATDGYDEDHWFVTREYEYNGVKVSARCSSTGDATVEIGTCAQYEN